LPAHPAPSAAPPGGAACAGDQLMPGSWQADACHPEAPSCASARLARRTEGGPQSRRHAEGTLPAWQPSAAAGQAV